VKSRDIFCLIPGHHDCRGRHKVSPGSTHITVSRYLGYVLCVLILSACLGGCGVGHWFKGQQQPPTASQLYKKAEKFFSTGRYVLAEKLFKQIQDQFPFSKYATVASLRYADCKFFEGNYEEAIPLYKQFIQLHPANQFIQYAIYQEGSCYFNLICSPDRDQTYTHKVVEIYQGLLNQFPNSPYRVEARHRISFAKERLAEHELAVADWYYRTAQLPQARYRCNYLISHYPHTPAVKKAKILLKKVMIRQRLVDEGKWHWWSNLFTF